MTNDALSVIDTISYTIFRLFTSWYIPGTNVTPAVALFGVFFVSFMFRFIGKLLGIWDDGKGDTK